MKTISMSSPLHLLSILLTLAALAEKAGANHSWPRWRGSEGSAEWKKAGLPDNVLGHEPRRLWTHSCGKGFGGLTVHNDHVYFMERTEQPDEVERLRCVDLLSGEERWSKLWPVTYGKMGGYSTGPRTSVTLHAVGDQMRAYALGATGQLLCLDAQSGKMIWQLDTVSKLKARVPQWGFAASPVIWKDRLLVHLGAEANGSTVALDPTTGTELWRGGRDEAGYCTPEVVELQGRTQLIQWGPEHVMGLDPVGGRELWTYPYKITYGVSIAQPLIQDDIVLVSGYWHGTKALKLNAELEPKLLWENEKEICGLMSSPLYKGGLVYLLDKNRGLTCFQLADGKILWRDENQLTPKDRNPHFSLVWMDKEKDLVALLNSNGELIYARITRQGVEELARHQVIGKTWAHPAFVGNRIVVRSDSEVAAWELWPEP